MLDFQLLVGVFIKLKFVSDFLQLGLKFSNDIILFQKLTVQIDQFLTWFPILHFESVNFGFELGNEFFLLLKHLSQSADVDVGLFDLLGFLNDFDGLFLDFFGLFWELILKWKVVDSWLFELLFVGLKFGLDERLFLDDFVFDIVEL